MSQNDKLLELLKDGKPHSTTEIVEKVYGNARLTLARVSARVKDLGYQGHVIEGRRGKINKKIWWYLLRSSPEQPVKMRSEFVPVMVEGRRVMKEVRVAA